MKKIFYVISIVLICELSAYGQSVIKGKYEYPVKPGTKEWERLETIEKRIEALQIPKMLLSDISTKDLLETCLDFPYLTDIFFCNNYQQGFEALVAEFNGFSEVMKRHDLVETLLEKYKDKSKGIEIILSQKEVEQGRFTFRYFVLEFMLAQDVVLRNLNLEQEKLLLLLSFEQKKIKKAYVNIFGNLNDLPTNLLYAKKIINDSEFKFENAEQKKVLLDFIQAPISIADQELANLIENYVNTQIK